MRAPPARLRFFAGLSDKKYQGIVAWSARIGCDGSGRQQTTHWRTGGQLYPHGMLAFV
jgi:hypothetical protein